MLKHFEANFKVVLLNFEYLDLVSLSTSLNIAWLLKTGLRFILFSLIKFNFNYNFGD